MQLCSHGDEICRNNFAFIKFKVGFDHHLGKPDLGQNSLIVFNNFQCDQGEQILSHLILLEGSFVCFL